MEIDKKLIQHIAELARLELSDEETDMFVPQFKDILGLFAQLDGIDTSGVDPSFHAIPLANTMAADRKKKCISQEEALSLTVHKKDGYFKGPKVV